MPHERRIFGTQGEERAVRFLEGKGWRVLARQQRTPFGEIDLVCLDAGCLVFVEVKARRTARFGPPQAAITPVKFRHMVAAARAYAAMRGWHGPWRLDVVAILHGAGGGERITHFPAIDSPAAC